MAYLSYFFSLVVDSVAVTADAAAATNFFFGYLISYQNDEIRNKSGSNMLKEDSVMTNVKYVN